MERISKYYKYIVIVLLVIVGLQTCKTCTNHSTIEYQKAEYTLMQDTLNKQINSCMNTILILNDSIKTLQNEIFYKDKLIESLDVDKRYLKEQNHILNRNLNKSLDKNE